MSLESPPTAIFSANYGIAVGALSWLKENGRHVPDDMGKVGTDRGRCGIAPVAQILD
ncbi:substrate-binding domain-containing protein, partial [Rhizobium johnstonii]|uniref:substrate-binding domain-containing protein n=1 Tax=Rhizobium johnstonii TaxID=3019933 RepID=UPI003F99CA5B